MYTITLDYKYADANQIGENHGLNIEDEFNNYSSTISDIIKNLYARKNQSGQWLEWMNFGYSEETVWYVKEYAALVENRFDNLLILGIGDSVLGGMAVTEALLNPYWNYLTKEQRNNYPRIFFLDNIDPDSINCLLESLDLTKTLVNVVTKSGDTAETMTQFMIVKDKLEKVLGDDYRKNIVATTDKNTGILRQIALQEGYKTFIVPDDVYGRFSVFSAVGLLPFALVGIDIDEMMRGIRDIDALFQTTDIHENIAAQNALIHYLLETKKGKNHVVLMPYSNRLKYVSDWVVQLWSESIGKEKDKDGNTVNVGSTPVKVLGATDSHSQVQMFNEGPNNKVIDFIKLGEFDYDLEIPNVFEYTGIGYLCGKTVKELLNAEALSTRIVLTDYSRPTITIHLPKLNAYYLAQLLYMFEVQAVICTELYNVQSSDQQAAEQARNYTYALMGRVGYEESLNTIKNKADLSLTN